MDGYDSIAYQYQEYDAYCDYLKSQGEKQIYGFYGQRLEADMSMNPFKWYEQELDNEHEAEMAGYDSYEEYYEAKQDDLANEQFDRWHEER